MFRRVPLSIVMSCLRAGSGWNILILLTSYQQTCMTCTIAVCTVETPDDGQWNCLKHVGFHSKNKNFEKLVHLVGSVIRNLSQCTVTWTSKKNQDNVVIVVVWLWAGRSRVWILARARDFYLPQTFKTGYGAHTATCSLSTGVLFQGQVVGGMNLTSNFYLMPRLRMSLAVPLFPLFVFMGWEGMTLCSFLNNGAHYFICWTIRGYVEWIPPFCKWW